MAMPNLDRSVGLICQTCAGALFSHDPENLDSPMQCVGCDRIYDREELLTENGERIEIQVEELKKEVSEYVRHKLRETFRGMKGFKVK